MSEHQMALHSANAYSPDLYPVELAEVQLVDKDLFQKFDKHQTEMIITKSGRRMYPGIKITVDRLDPNADYCFYVEMELHTRNRFKYNLPGGWEPQAQEETQSPRNQRLYVHPDSPSKGSHWMANEVQFTKMKLTNVLNSPDNIVLSSQHRYQPRIIIAKTSRPDCLDWAPAASFVFSETKFFAVTAYQNDAIKKLKIDNNPFAKGFRENGKSSTKRKRSIENCHSPASTSTDTSATPPLQNETLRNEIRVCPQDYPTRVPQPPVPVYSQPPRVMPVYYPPPYFCYDYWCFYNPYPYMLHENHPAMIECREKVRMERQSEMENLQRVEELKTEEKSKTEVEEDIEIDIENDVEPEEKAGNVGGQEIGKPVTITNFSVDAILRWR